MNRIDNISEKDKLWELYLHTLAGYHGNFSTNDRTPIKMAEEALAAAQSALKVWKKNS